MQDEFDNDDNFGLTWIIKNLIRNTKQPNLLGTNEEQEALVEQWLEYVSTHLSHLNTMQSNEIHSILKVGCIV